MIKWKPKNAIAKDNAINNQTNKKVNNAFANIIIKNVIQEYVGVDV